MEYSVYYGSSIAQAREECASAARALELAADLKRRGALGIFVVEEAGREISLDSLAARAAVEADTTLKSPD